MTFLQRLQALHEAEKAVAVELKDHVRNNNLDELFQSAYKAGHSTETALLRVQNDVLRAIDNGGCVMLLLLDLSAAFDTVDHSIFLSRLKFWYSRRSVSVVSILFIRSYPVCCGW